MAITNQEIIMLQSLELMKHVHETLKKLQEVM